MNRLDEMPGLDPVSLPLRGVQLIEASAGTGKTYTIAAVYLRLILGHRLYAPFLPPDILVLTFTEAAAGELRDRIRRRLVEAARVFRNGEGGDELLQRLLADYSEPAARQAAAWRLAQAAQWLDDAAISTIHAWCLRVLREHAFDSASPFQQTLVKDLAAWRETAVRDVWRQRFYPLPVAEARVVRELLDSPDVLSRTLAPLLASPEGRLCDGDAVPLPLAQAWTDWRHGETAAADARAAVLAGWATHQAEVMERLTAALADKVLNGGQYRAKAVAALPADLQAWQAGGEPPALLAKLGTRAFQEPKRVNSGKTAPAHPWFDQVDAWVDAQASHLQARRQLHLALLADLRDAVAERLQTLLRAEASLGFDDLLQRVSAALARPDGERLATRLRQRYPIALIDEFQDTDPLQFGIFRRLYVGRDDATLLLIGDPKQAIYSFRGADLPTYLSARALAGRTHGLDRNFRSTAPLIDTLNALFGQAAARWPEGPFATPPAPSPRHLDYPPVTANAARLTLWQRVDGAWQPAPAVQLAIPADGQTLGVDAARQVIAARCADTLADWFRQAQAGDLGFAAAPPHGNPATLQPLQPGDIAILVRSRSEARVMRRALTRAGLPSVFGSDRDSVWHSPEAEHVQCWLEAFEQPADEARLRRALATPVLGLDAATLARLRQDEQRWEAEVLVLQRMQASWQRDGVLAALRAWLFHHQVPARLLHPERAEGERALTNLLHLAELLEQAAVGLQGQHALIRHLAEQRRLPAGQGEDDAMVRLESDSARLRVVTVHQSKGLEYPVVMYPFAAMPRSPRGGDATVRTHDDADTLVFDLDRDKDGPARTRARRETLQEDLRLFYVAVTRARHLLWMALAPVTSGNVKRPGTGTPWAYLMTGQDSLAPDGWSEALRDLLAAVPGLYPRPWSDDHRHPRQRVTLTQPASALQPARTFPGLPRTRWWIASYSALAQVDSAPQPRPAAPETASDDRFTELALSRLAELPRGAEIGTFWHDLLEWMTHQGFARCQADPSRVDAEILRRCTARGWSDQVEPLQAAARHWLSVPLQLPEAGAGRRPGPALSGLDTVYPELEFWLAAGHVDVTQLDALITRHALPGHPRPALAPAQLQGLFKGFMDLVFCHDGRYYVADYKSNHLGDSPVDYAPQRLVPAILAHRYELQYCLYLLALHRLLQSRLPDYDYDRHIGGAVYLFLRGWRDDGHGVHVERPPRALIEGLDRLFLADALTRDEVPHVAR